MAQWIALWQAVSAPLVVAIIGGLVTMYSRVEGHGQKIEQLQKDTAANTARIDGVHERVHTIELTTARIDENVKELLRVQTRDAAHSGRQ